MRLESRVTVQRPSKRAASRGELAEVRGVDPSWRLRGRVFSASRRPFEIMRDRRFETRSGRAVGLGGDTAGLQARPPAPERAIVTLLHGDGRATSHRECVRSFPRDRRFAGRTPP